MCVCEREREGERERAYERSATVLVAQMTHGSSAMVSIAESLRTWASDTKELMHGEPVLNKNRFSVLIPIYETIAQSVFVGLHRVCWNYL